MIAAGTFWGWHDAETHSDEVDLLRLVNRFC
jgi:hypothetical protein